MKNFLVFEDHRYVTPRNITVLLTNRESSGCVYSRVKQSLTFYHYISKAELAIYLLATDYKNIINLPAQVV